jgi:hypothetical protein
MHRATKLVALGAVAAVLAACSGTGSNSSLPSTQSNNTGGTAQSTYPRSEMSSDGHVLVYFYNKQIETSGLVSHGGNVGLRTPQSIITGAMTYHGGPIQTAPKIYIDLWGNWGSTGDPDGVANYYTSYISGVGGSQWMSTVTQYTQSNGQAVGNAAGSYAGTWNDTTNKIPRLSGGSYQSSLAAEAQRAAAHFGDYSASASYIIMVPHGVSVSGFGTRYCAWHSSTSATGGTIAYTNLPYIPDAGANCGSGSVNSPGTDDGVSIVGGHEQAETETDPQPNSGWLDSGGNEIGDKCAWVNLQNTSFSTGSFPTQPLWSNSANGCVQ